MLISKRAPIEVRKKHSSSDYRIFLVTLWLLVNLCSVAYAETPCRSSTCHPGPKPSFHNAEGLICAKCHTMHYSEDGTTPPDADAGGPFQELLLKSKTTDLCLICHQAPLNGTGAPIVLTPDGTMGTNYPLLPGGDFYYSKTDQRKGHNPGGIVIGSDSILTLSPGGGFSSSDETCISCHDPHGGSSANEYRLLRKRPAGWTGADLLVDGKETHPGSDEGGQKNEKKPRYYSGFSAWCGACHSNPDDTGSGFHGSTKTDPDVGDGADWFRHPTDKALGDTIANNYGTQYTLPYHVEKISGPDDHVTAQDEVFCLSCHRAHAWENSNSTYWDNAGASGSGTGCNKCHAKGE